MPRLEDLVPINKWFRRNGSGVVEAKTDAELAAIVGADATFIAGQDARYGPGGAIGERFGSPVSSLQTRIGVVEKSTDPIWTVADSALVSLYHPWCVPVREYTPGADDEFYMWVSTDHDSGGIERLSAPTPTGPFTSDGTINNWIVDLDDGTAPTTPAETPSVLWDDINEQWVMWAHRANITGASGDQTTCWATSPDADTWTAQGIAIDTDPDEWPGDGHSGYFHPARIGDLWFGTHLMGGGGTGYRAISWAYGAEGPWFTDPRPLGRIMLADGTMVSEPRHIVQINGRPWTLVPDNTAGSSGGSGTATRVLAVPLSADFRRAVGAPVTIVEATEAWETASAFRIPTAMSHGGKLYVYYGTTDAIGVATITIGASS